MTEPARRAAVLGSPIAHSLSPALHLAAYRELGLTGWRYDAVECDEAGLPGLIASLGPEWAGLSLTMPLKRAVLPLLDTVEPLAEQVGAVNTVVLRAGQRSGFNTDVAGMVTAVRQAWTPSAGNALVLGAGATACSALVALRDLGLTAITVAVRSAPRAGPLLAVARRLGIDVAVTGLGPGLAHRPWQLLISTIPSAGVEEVTGLVAAGELTAAAVLDVIYDPWPTALAQAADKAGSSVISGYEMLVQQAVGQVELMTGRTPDAAAMRAAGQAEMTRRRNIRSAGWRS